MLKKVSWLLIGLPYLLFAQTSNLFNSGYEEYFRNNLDGAEEAFKKAIEQEPGIALYHLYLGKTYHRKAEEDKAKKSLLEAIRLDGKEKRAYLLLGEIYFAEESFKEAEVYYKKAVELEPLSFDGHFKLGQVYLKFQEPDKAIYHLMKADEIEKDVSWVFFYLGQAYLGKDDKTSAIGAFNRAIMLESNNPLFYYWRGNGYFASADYNSPNDNDFHSADDYRMSIEFGLSTPACYFMYGNTLLNRGFYHLKTERQNEALDYFETSIVKYKKVLSLDSSASNGGGSCFL